MHELIHDTESNLLNIDKMVPYQCKLNPSNMNWV